MRLTPLLVAATALLTASPALAWGHEGHEIIADIARSRLSPAVRARVDAILATDTGALTGHHMASEAAWADAWRGAGHREPASWHFVDVELDAPDLTQACFGHPAPATPPSAGPEQDCVVDKIGEFAAELKAPTSSPDERLLALKYLLHFIGDVHQPLHTADNHDRGGNCVSVLLGPNRTVNLHAIWDTVLVEALGTDPATAAAEIGSHITPAQVAAWQAGDAASWARESFRVARAIAFPANSPSGCGPSAAPIELPNGYQGAAMGAAALQLARAGIRLAYVLDQALGTGAR